MRRCWLIHFVNVFFCTRSLSSVKTISMRLALAWRLCHHHVYKGEECNEYGINAAFFISIRVCVQGESNWNRRMTRHNHGKSRKWNSPLAMEHRHPGINIMCPPALAPLREPLNKPRVIIMMTAFSQNLYALSVLYSTMVVTGYKEALKLAQEDISPAVWLTCSKRKDTFRKLYLNLKKKKKEHFSISMRHWLHDVLLLTTVFSFSCNHGDGLSHTHAPCLTQRSTSSLLKSEDSNGGVSSQPVLIMLFFFFFFTVLKLHNWSDWSLSLYSCSFMPFLRPSIIYTAYGVMVARKLATIPPDFEGGVEYVSQLTTAAPCRHQFIPSAIRLTVGINWYIGEYVHAQCIKSLILF